MAHSLHQKFSCGVELALEIVSGKWKPVILAHLKEGTLRYAELRALIPALSDKMLAQRLKDLEGSAWWRDTRRAGAAPTLTIS